MRRIFRQPNSGGPGYAALALFAVAYLAAMALVLSPETFVRGAAPAISAPDDSP